MDDTQPKTPAHPLAGLVKAAAAAAVLLFLSACWISETQVITMEMAVEIPGLEGEHAFDDNVNTIAAVPFSNDYRVHSIDFEGAVTNGTFRAVPLRSNIYIVQLLFDGEATYSFAFYRFTGGPDPEIVEMVPSIDVNDLAAEHGVVLDGDEIGLFGSLEGEAEDIMEFLQAHRAVPLEPF